MAADIVAVVSRMSLATRIRDSGYTITFDGTTEPVGGTSAVAPLYAGLVALLNASLGEPVGYLNPRLYSLRGGVVFREVDDGVSNASGGAPGYTSGPGWNACTGLGSINGHVLLSNPLLTLRAIQPTFQALSSTEAYVLGERQPLARDRALGHRPTAP